MKYFFQGLLVFAVIFLSGCDNEPDCTKEVSADRLAAVDQTQLASDIIAIDNYLAQNSITALTEPNGLRYVISTPGTGETPCQESYVTVTYTGRLMSNGNIFDSSSVPQQFQLSQLILGWQIGFPLLPKGSIATLYIPSGYGYGPTGGGPIPPNANLIFNVELIDVR
ncbi:MAG: hypothetical protein HC811_05870 [Flammeovirgaceae bacterium]|nr:hypothetical protein [Flammeovirgaceae bacterium]